jgi:inorganic pyrophosphatase
MTTFSKWTHPATGAVRVYIGSFSNTKVWAEACEVDSFGFDYKIVAVNPNRNRSELGNTIDDAERAIFTAAQSRVKSFTQVLALAA